ncbi:Nmad5 family putative nucleotide modification protein [Vibrio casei]|uniref:Nmad5 family putative nucleotide modification protein n=1 Tax=Vibrio casei TaxID=673372 RepID=UPI003F983BAD
MSRLNKTIREKIINNALNASGVIERNEKLIERRAKLANDVRLFALGGEDVEREILSKVEKIKSYTKKNGHKLVSVSVDICRTDYEIKCNFSGMSVNLSFNGFEAHKRPVKRLPFVMGDYGNRVVITRDNPLFDEFEVIEIEQKTIHDLSNQVKMEVGAIVNSVTTIKKLVEVWPECVDLLPPEEKQTGTAMVANVDNLNAMIGLPKGDDK